MALTQDEMWEMYKASKAKELGQSADLYNQKNQLLDTNLATQQAGMARAKTNAQQGASIANDKLNKYLGQKNLASGVATGQTGSDFIQANNAYSQNRAGINNDFSAQQRDLLQYYATGKFQNQQDQFQNETAINDKWYGREDQARREAELKKQSEFDSGLADAKMTFNEAINFYLEGDNKIDSEEEKWLREQYSKYSGTYGDKLGTYEDIMNMYLQAGKKEAAATEVAEAEAAEAATFKNAKDANQREVKTLNDVTKSIGSSWWGQSGANRFWGDNPEFEYGGVTYRVQTNDGFDSDTEWYTASAIKSQTSPGKAKIVSYGGKDYLTDGNVIYRVKAK